MPAAFERCVKNGGRVRTIKPREDVYMKICYLNGKSYHGEVHHVSKKKISDTNRKALSKLAKKKK